MTSFDYSTLPRAVDVPDKPVTFLLDEAVSKFPDNVAIDFFGAKITYREFDRQTQKLMNVLRGLGVKRGEAVAVMSANCPQAMIAYQAILRIGGIVVLTNPLYVEREIEHQFKDAGVKIALVLNLMAGKVKNVMDKTPVEKIIVIKLEDYMPWPISWLFPIKLMIQKQKPATLGGAQFLKWSELMDSASDQAEPADVKPDDIALYQYTGGTTGVAKGVELTHRNLISNALQGKAWFVGAREGEEVFMLTLPVFHAFGMTVGMNLGISLCATIVVEPKFDALRIMKQIEKHKATMFPGVPAMYVAIINHPKAASCDISSIKYCISGAAPLALETREKFEAMTGGKLVEGYGLTEASPITHCNPLPGGVKTGSIGMALPSTEYKIIDDETGKEAALGEVGELLVKGPQVMRGYKGAPDETAKAIKDGWLYTGDMASADEDGFCFIMDRKKELVISGGCNVFPKEVEDVLRGIDGVSEVAVIGLPDPRFGEKVTAVIVLKEGATLTESEIIAHSKAGLAGYKIPKKIVFVDSLPKTIIGKVLKRELKKQIEGKS